jgi:TM2 domain-containing membrane protein YozV
MNCANHPEVTASAFCRECGKPMCQECQRPALGSIYCAEHLPVVAPPPPSSAGYAAPAASPYTASAPPVYDQNGAHPALALILGFIPGVGAIYNGQYAKGLIHVVVFGLLISLASSTTHGALEPLLGLLIAAWVFYMAFEAYHTARKRRYGVAVEEFSSLFDIRPTQGRFPAGAILLIGLGFVLLLDTTEIISMEQLERYWPVGLILFGLYLVYVRINPGHHTPNDSGNGGQDRNAEVRR